MGKPEESELSNERQNEHHRDQDGGWAWVILFFTCVFQIMGGLVYTTGLFNIMFLEEFGESRQTTAWIGSIQSSSKSLYGPLSALVHHHVGGRLTVIIGAVIGFTGFVSASFAKSFVWLFFTFGVLLGLGTGISYIAWVMAIGMYFKKYRNLAYGIASASSGVGVVILSPLIQYLSGHFGWRGCVLIMSAIYLNNIAVGLVFIPRKAGHQEEDGVEVEVKAESETKSAMKQYTAASMQSLNSISSETNSQMNHNMRLRSNTWPERQSESLGGLEHPRTQHGKDKTVLEQIQKQHMHYETELRNESLTRPRAFKLNCNDWATASIQSLTTVGSTTSLIKGRIRSNTNASELKGNLHQMRPRSSTNVSLPARTAPILGRRSVFRKHLPDHNATTHGQLEQQEISDMNQVDGKCPESQGRKLCRILANRRLWVVVFNAVCTQASCLLVYLHFPDLFRLNGASDSQLSLTMACSGAASMLCRVLVGMASGSEDVGVLILYLGCGIINGTFILFAPVLAKTFAGQMTFAVFFGFYGNAYNSLLPALTLDICNLEDLSFAYGLVLLICGIGGAVGPPFGGWLFDITGNYAMTFYFAGALCTLGSVSLLLIPVLGHRQLEDDPPLKNENI